MPYRVFLVEDEIITREGIRDNVDWGRAGFEFCGEASDGEMALPLIEETKPDVLITDIKMPFMDGLQLSKIIREHMPWVKVVILSGHNEFEYAQSAVKLGVTEYLLKPVSAQDLHQTLVGLAATLDQENREREKLKSLQTKVEDTLILSREKFLLKLVMGGVSSAEAVEQSQQFGLDIVARYYIVVLIRIELCENAPPFDYQEYQRVEQIVSQFAENNSDVLMTKKDPEELVLLITGNGLRQLVQEGAFLAGLIEKEVENQTTCNAIIELGTPQDRLGDIHHSFAEALVKSKSGQQPSASSPIDPDQVEQLKLDHTAVGNFLKFGTLQDFESFFASTLQSIAEIAVGSETMKQYLFVDIILTAIQFMSDLDEEIEQLESDIQGIDGLLKRLKSLDQIKAELRRIFGVAINIRDSQVNPEITLIIRQAQAYLDDHFSDPDLQMSRVAQKYNLSTGHFSTSFHQEVGETFRDYLARLRLYRAKELLRTTNLKIAEVAYQSGFSDSHYFSSVFKKKTGRTPRQFRNHSDPPVS
jgi:two-component system response regulator YesN